MPCVILMPLAPWQLVQFISARRLPSAMSTGETLSVRNSSPGWIAADCAAAPGQLPTIAAPAMAANIRRLFVLGCIAIYAFMDLSKPLLPCAPNNYKPNAGLPFPIAARDPQQTRLAAISPAGLRNRTQGLR